MRAEDDRSQVNYFLDCGTVKGGKDVFDQFSLGGPKTTIDEVSIVLKKGVEWRICH